MPSVIFIILSAAAGAVTGFVFVLWLKSSVRNLDPAHGARMGLNMVLGYLGRIVLCAVCFAGVSYGGHLDRLIAAVIGFAVTHAVTVIVFKNGMLKMKSGASHDDQSGQD